MFVHRRTLLGLCPSRQNGDGSGDGGFEVIPWDTWGPNVTRWMSAEVASARWITTTAGARAAVMVENDGTIVLMDFHPARLHRAKDVWVEQGGTVIVHPAFEDPLVSRLPYSAQMLEGMEMYEGLLMDEERLIGLQTDELGSRIRKIEIFHLGTQPPGSAIGGGGSEAPSINEIVRVFFLAWSDLSTHGFVRTEGRDGFLALIGCDLQSCACT